MEKRILIVEDDPDARQIFRALLEHLGYAVSETADGRTAPSLAHRETPDLVLLDLRLPGANGLEVAERLRGQGSTAGVPIVMVTADDGASLSAQARSLGCGLLRKPVEPRLVATTVRKLIGPP